ncbi:tyrosine-type recombinase/integrase [Candidatus Latescibacterota bacterium]
MAMKKGHNDNAPAKGISTKVEPIKKSEDIDRIKMMLFGNPRNYTLFILGINTNLRASDLCGITVGQVRGLKTMDEIEIKEKKTGKTRRITLNNACIDAINGLLRSKDFSDSDYLFKGQRGPIRPETVHALVKSWAKEIKLKGNYGSHSLRKTWGYQQRVRFNVGIPALMACFNHSTQKQTLDYLCVQPEEIKSVYANEI